MSSFLLFQGMPEAEFKWRVWRNYSIDYAQQFKEAWEVKYEHIFSTFKPGNFFVASYERLTSDNEMEKFKELGKISQFLGFPIDDDRIQCAYLMSFNKKVKRVLQDTDMTIEKAYSDPLTLCPVVDILQQTSKNKHIEKNQLDMTRPVLSQMLWGGVYSNADPISKC